MDVSQWVAHRANWSPEKVAVRFEGREITYASLEDQVGRLAGAFADELGVQGRDRVAYLGHSSPEALTALFACARLGAAIVPMNARLTIPEHQTILLDCQPVLLVAETRYSYHAFITDRAGQTLELEADHRRHAEIENAIRDLKYGVGLNHLPSGRFAANGAWLAVQVIAHNLARWTARIGLAEGIVTTKTLRRRLFALAGRLTRSARQLTLHLPAR